MSDELTSKQPHLVNHYFTEPVEVPSIEDLKHKVGVGD